MACVACVAVRAHARLPTLVQGFERSFENCIKPPVRLFQRYETIFFFFFFLFTCTYICIYKCFLRPLKIKKNKTICRLYNIHIPQVYYIKSSPFEPLFIKISRRLVARAPFGTLFHSQPYARFYRTFPATAFAQVLASVSRSS